ncbi:exodeoxyribonuclease III [Leeuwenhoekiella aequorea]|uniref:Exodeoxyribonuclease-3 n=1 Tax=Leeuwenhoekiella aequorea TaxID=283736 RepID=A0A4Q0PEB2_9FLAO|nr:exodeoxyribonuclease III [Leeuwenhoekiella aequorea]RXG24439.1 exodeoxyribonuclease-3 [Leeuwenhoekiella aequorea]
MKIITYNVNGIRAALKKGLLDWIKQADPDVLLLQETKAHKEQVDVDFLQEIGYHDYWFSAQKKGYSGVAILTKKEPDNVVHGTGIDYMDFEGRNIRVDFGDLSIMSMYLPSGTNVDRLEHKFKYMSDFQVYADELRKTRPNLVVGGDYNICHEAIDIHDPVRLKNVSGFLPVEREWMTELITSGFTDSFRHLNPEVEQYSWWSYRANARANNKGWRLDYNMVSEPLKNAISRAVILPEAKHSDHCPALLELDYNGL